MKRDVLKAVLKKMEERDIELNRINIQKIVFYLKERGNPLNYKYEPYFYGPYSSELQNELDDMVFWDELEEKENNGKKVYSTKSKESININSNILDSIDKDLDKLSKAIEGNFTFDTMEIAGTLIYCMKALEEFGKDPTEDNVIKEFKEWKGNKYKLDKVKSIFNKINPIVSK